MVIVIRLSVPDRNDAAKHAQKSSGWLLSPVPITSGAERRANLKRSDSLEKLEKEYQHKEMVASLARAAANVKVERKKMQKTPDMPSLAEQGGGAGFSVHVFVLAVLHWKRNSVPTGRCHTQRLRSNRVE